MTVLIHLAQYTVETRAKALVESAGSSAFPEDPKWLFTQANKKIMLLEKQKIFSEG